MTETGVIVFEEAEQAGKKQKLEEKIANKVVRKQEKVAKVS